eukprot:m.343820 g.343820  ORF g.343820 m.343820 type:complete len:385 (-) comp23402_c0_seq1:133-1287(-)
MSEESNGKRKRKLRSLLKEVRKGDHHYVEKLLKKGRCNQTEVNDTGTTGLMVAARRGDKKMVQVLLRQGTDVLAKDFQGNTALHMVTDRHDKIFYRVAIAMAILETMSGPKALVCENKLGVSPHNGMMNLGMRAKSAAEKRKETVKVQEFMSLLEMVSDMGQQEPQRTEQDEWRDKLAQAFDEDVFEFGAEPYRGPPTPDITYEEEIETEEEYRQRIQAEMRAKAEKRHFVFTDTEEAEAAAKKRRIEKEKLAQEFEQKARENSERLIAEQLARDKLLKEKKDMRSAKAYFTKVEAFFSLPAKDRDYSFINIPWPPEESADELSAILFYNVNNEEERKKIIKKEQIRWHPDKWSGQLNGRVSDEEKEKIMNRITEISKIFNTLV